MRAILRKKRGREYAPPRRRNCLPPPRLECGPIVTRKRAVATSVDSLTSFLAARDFLLAHRDDYETAYRDFRWPQLDTFNWALDYFDVYARGNAKPALWIVDDSGPELKLSFAECRSVPTRLRTSSANTAFGGAIASSSNF